MSSSLATSRISSMKSSDSSMDSRSCRGRRTGGWLPTSHRWKRSGVVEARLEVGAATASCTRLRRSKEACCLSHCSTRAPFDSSHCPADTKSSSAAGGVIIVPHVLTTRETTRMASRWTANCTVSCRLAAHASPGQRCVEVLIRGAQRTDYSTPNRLRMSSTRPSREDRRGRRRGHLGRKPKAHNYFNSSSNLHIRNKHPTRETNFYNFDDRFPKKDKIFKISRTASQQRAHRKSTPTTIE
jgi:hypothetical protein